MLVVPIDDASLSNVQLVSESTSGRAAAPHDADEPLQVMSSGREDEEATQPLHQQSSSASQLSGAHPPTPSPPPPPHALASSSSTAAAASHLERKSTADDTSQPSRQQAAQPFTLSFTQQSTLAAAGGVLASESGAAAVDEQQSENAFGDDSGDDASVAPRLCVPQTQVPNEEASLHEHLHEAEASDGSAQAVVVDVLVPSSVPDSPLLLQQPARPPPPPEMSLVIESEHSVDDVVVPPTQFDDDGEVVVTDSVVVSVSAERSSSESFTAPSTATDPTQEQQQRRVVPTTPVTRRSKSPSFTILTLLYKHGVVNVGSVLVYKSHRAVVTKDVWLDSADEKFPSVHQWLLAVDPNIILNDGDWHRFVQIDSDAASGNGLTLADHSASILSSKLRASKPAAVATRAVRDTPTPPPSPLPAIAAAGGADSPDWQKRPAAGDGVVRKRQRRRSPSPTPATATSSTATTASTSADNWHSSRRVVSSAVKQRTLEEMLAKPIVTKLVVEAPTIAEKEDVVNETPPRLPTQRATLYSAKKRAAAVASEEVLDNASNSASAMPPPPLPVSTKKKQKSSKSRSKRSPPPVPAAAAVERDEASEHSAEPVVILGSNLTSVQLLELRQLAGRLGFEVVDEWSGRVTHLVMPRCDGERVVVRRTIKYLYALMSGIWILEWAWVEACLRADRHEPEAAFEAQGDENMSESGAPRIMRQRTLSERHLLSEFVVYVHAKLSPDEGAPPREAIAELAQLCGAKLINEPPSASDVRRWTNKQRSQRYTSVLIVCDDASLGARGVDALFNRAGANLGLAPVIRYTWVIDCVSAAQQLRLAPYFCMASAPVAQHSIAF